MLNIDFFCSKSERLQTLIQDQNLSGYALKQKGACIDVVKASQDLKRQFLQKIESRYKDLEDDIIAATVIGNLNNWPAQNDAG